MPTPVVYFDASPVHPDHDAHGRLRAYLGDGKPRPCRMTVTPRHIPDAHVEPAAPPVDVEAWRRHTLTSAVMAAMTGLSVLACVYAVLAAAPAAAPAAAAAAPAVLTCALGAVYWLYTTHTPPRRGAHRERT